MKKHHELMEAKYGFPFPEDFFRFWDFVTVLAAEGIYLSDAPLHIQLGTAFQVFSADLDVAQFDPLLESRYRNDPPEFFTVLGGLTDGLHWGYYSDHPEAGEWIVASYYHSDSYDMAIVGTTLLQAVRRQLEAVWEDVADYLVTDVAHASDYEQWLERLSRIREVLMRFETGDDPTTGLAYLQRNICQREVTAPNKAGVGIVLDAMVDDPLYRESIGVSRLLQKSELNLQDCERLLALADNCLQDGYPGTALRIGQELWLVAECWVQVQRLLQKTYAALGRPGLQKALMAAIQFREKINSKK
jgi:hypothetical protein